MLCEKEEEDGEEKVPGQEKRVLNCATWLETPEQVPRTKEPGFGYSLVRKKSIGFERLKNYKPSNVFVQMTVYKEGAFTRTHQLVSQGHMDNEYYTLEMEVFDRKRCTCSIPSCVVFC